ncbi:MAG: MFS transporter [Pseudomonadales bacterium]
MLTLPGIPYWRLSAFYFFYFALLGASVPYWGLFLQDRGFSALEIGYLSAILMVTKVVAPNAWGWLASRTGHRLSLIRFANLAALLIFSGVFLGDSFLLLALVTAGFSFFWNAVLAQFEVITMGHLGKQYQHYGRVRVWGSVGFIVVVVGLGWLFERQPISLLPIAMALSLALLWLCSMTIQEVSIKSLERPTGHLKEILKKPWVAGFFVVTTLLQVSHGVYYTFYSIHLEAAGYSRMFTGQLWALGVIAEVLIFLLMHRLFRRYSLRGMLLFSLFVSCLRWYLIGFYVQFVSLLLIAQLLHAFSFGMTHAVAVEFIRQQFVAQQQGQGMAIYSGISFGGGGAIGALISGFTWELGAETTFMVAIIASALAFLVAWWSVRGFSTSPQIELSSG